MIGFKVFEATGATGFSVVVFVLQRNTQGLHRDCLCATSMVIKKKNQMTRNALVPALLNDYSIPLMLNARLLTPPHLPVSEKPQHDYCQPMQLGRAIGTKGHSLLHQHIQTRGATSHCINAILPLLIISSRTLYPPVSEKDMLITAAIPATTSASRLSAGDTGRTLR